MLRSLEAMANGDLEWDGITPQPPRPTGTPEDYGSTSISSESSESISESASLLKSDSKQVANYGTAEIVGDEQDVVAESDGAIEVLRTPKAIAAIISVLLVGEVYLSNFLQMSLMISSQVSSYLTLTEALSSQNMERSPLNSVLLGMQAG